MKDKNKNKKYIIVDAKDINITLRQVERVSGFNDFWNEYKPSGLTTAKKVFRDHQIPEEFHKIVFALPTCRCCKSNGQEVLTGRLFEIHKSPKSKKYFGSECGRLFNGDIIGCSIDFKTPKQKQSYDSILSFYEHLTEQGYLDSYVDAIKSMFFVKNELEFNGESTKVEDKAKELLKTKQSKKAS